MGTMGWNPSRHGLDNHGIRKVIAYWNLPDPVLYEHAVRKNEGLVAEHGPLVCRTGDHTGRSPNDKFLVKEPSSDNHIWWGTVNRPFEPGRFDALHGHLCTHLEGKELYVQDCYAGADPEHRLPIRVITELAWHSLFARNLFIRPDAAQTGEHVPEFTIISAPGFRAILSLGFSVISEATWTTPSTEPAVWMALT